MNKQELIQTHHLLALVKTEAEELDILDEAPQYAEEGVGPQAIHKSKNAHKDAILALADDLSGGFEEAEPETSEKETVEAETVAP